MCLDQCTPFYPYQTLQSSPHFAKSRGFAKICDLVKVSILLDSQNIWLIMFTIESSYLSQGQAQLIIKVGREISKCEQPSLVSCSPRTECDLWLVVGVGLRLGLDTDQGGCQHLGPLQDTLWWQYCRTVESRIMNFESSIELGFGLDNQN